MHRLNSHTAPLRQAVPSGHDAYARGPVSGPQDPRWQLPPTPATGPEHDAAVVFAHLAAAQKALEKAEQEALASIELDPAILAPARKKKPIGKPSVPPLEAA